MCYEISQLGGNVSPTPYYLIFTDLDGALPYSIAPLNKVRISQFIDAIRNDFDKYQVLQ